MKIAIGADHRGFIQKEFIKCAEFEHQVTWVDVGAYDTQRSDYPIFAKQVCDHVLDGTVNYGVLLCGTGNGMAITANRYAGIYAGVAWNTEVARLAREHDNVNVLVIPSDYINNDVLMSMMNAWLGASFFGGRYQERIEMIDKLNGVTN